MGENVTPKQKRAVAALLTSGDVSSAAVAAGVSRQTLYRWLSIPAFRAALAEAEREALANISRQLVSLGDTATATLARGMSDPLAAASARIRAADIVLGRLLELRQLVTLEERVIELERRIGGTNGK